MDNDRPFKKIPPEDEAFLRQWVTYRAIRDIKGRLIRWERSWPEVEEKDGKEKRVV